MTTTTQPHQQTIAVLGTGLMGFPIADRLLSSGFVVRVWNRTAHKARPLGEHGAVLAATASAAAAGADVVLTMLSDERAIAEVMTGALPAMTPGAVWLQMSTVGVAGNERLAGLAEQAGVPYVDAPVLGTVQPARQGKLIVLAAGPDAVRDRLAPLLEAIGARTMWLGAAGAGSRLKLVANNWVLAVTQGVAESFALAEALELDPALFLDAIRGGPLDVAYAQLKGAAITARQFPASFPARLAAKDAGLVLDAAAAGADLAGTRAAREHLEATVALGYGDQDMAAMFYACRPDAVRGA